MAAYNIIGIGGTDGSGKDSVGQMLVQRHGWLFISVTDILREEATRCGISLKRNTLRQISAEWRKQYGLGVLIDKALEIYKNNSQNHKGLVLASLRNPGEADRIHALGGQVVWIDADPHIRYNRIMARKRGTEDEVTFEEFQAEEEAQSHNAGDKNALSLNDVRAAADIFIENNGSDIEAFKNDAEKALADILK